MLSVQVSLCKLIMDLFAQTSEWHQNLSENTDPFWKGRVV